MKRVTCHLLRGAAQAGTKTGVAQQAANRARKLAALIRVDEHPGQPVDDGIRGAPRAATDRRAPAQRCLEKDNAEPFPIGAVRRTGRGHEHIAEVVCGPLREIVNVAQHSNSIGNAELAREPVQSCPFGSVAGDNVPKPRVLCCKLGDASKHQIATLALNQSPDGQQDRPFVFTIEPQLPSQIGGPRGDVLGGWTRTDRWVHDGRRNGQRETYPP